MNALTGVTRTGFSYSIPAKRLNNYELVETLAELENNPLLLPKVLKLLLGVEGTEKLKDHVRDEDGIVDSEKMSEELQDIFQAQARLKN